MRGGGTNARKRQATVVEGEKGGLRSTEHFVQAAFFVRGYFPSNGGHKTPKCTYASDTTENRCRVH